MRSRTGKRHAILGVVLAALGGLAFPSFGGATWLALGDFDLVRATGAPTIVRKPLVDSNPHAVSTGEQFFQNHIGMSRGEDVS